MCFPTGFMANAHRDRQASKLATQDVRQRLLIFVCALSFLLFHPFDFASATDRELSGQELDLPAILLPEGTRVPENLSNPNFWRDWIEEMRGTPLPEDFRDVAHLFKEEGERLGIFWPAVLIQSLHETDFYRYGGRTLRESFNVGGVGITPDERTTTRQDFHTLRNGIRAMLEHVAVYADPYKMEKVIREQNFLKHGVRRFTAKRTEQQFSFIRHKYDLFQAQWPDRPVRINDLGSWVPDEKVKQMEGFKKHGHTRQLIRGASLAYAEDPFYGAKLYRIWHLGASYVRDQFFRSWNPVYWGLSPVIPIIR